MKDAGERAGAMRAIWRAVESAAGTWLKSNGASPPRERLTQEQVEEWKQQRAASLVCVGRTLAGLTLRGPISKARTFGMRTFLALETYVRESTEDGVTIWSVW